MNMQSPMGLFRFRIGPHDRMMIDGEPYRMTPDCQADDGYVLEPVSGDGPPQKFFFTDLHEMTAAGRIRHERDFFLPEELRSVRLPLMETSSVALLTQAQKKRLDIRYALVQALKEVISEGLVKRTEASIAENMAEIEARAPNYLVEPANLLLSEQEARAAEGRRKSAGGMARTTLSGFHPRTLLKHLRDEERFGKAGLADRIAARGNHNPRYSPEVQALVMSVIRKTYLNLNRGTIKQTIDDVESAFADENDRRVNQNLVPLPVPRPGMVKKMIKGISAFHAFAARHGLDEAKKEFRPVLRGPEVSRPLERVEIDEHKIDLMTLMTIAGLKPLFTPAELKALGLEDGKKARWWLVMAIDCRTRAILGLVLTKDPNRRAAIQCLRMIVSDKSQITDAAGAKSGWFGMGKPELLVADNGSAFKSIEFTDACNDLGITLERTLAKTPQMRGKIERLYGTVSRNLVPRLPGRTFSNVVEKGTHPAEERACLGPEELCKILVLWIVDVYHSAPHEGLSGRSPRQQWQMDIAAGNYPLHAAPDNTAKRIAFGLPRKSRANREGVTVLGLQYQSKALAALVFNQGEQYVDIRWDEENIGKISANIDGVWETLDCVEEGFEGVHAQVWIAACRSLRAQDPAQKEWERRIARDAIKSITAIGAQASLEFQLLEKGYDEAYLRSVEASLLSSIRLVPDRPQLEAVPGELGRTIVPAAPVTSQTVVVDKEAALAPLKRRRQDPDWDFA